MASYGRNFEFRIPPNHGARGGRFAAPAATLGGGTGSPLGLIPIGAPVVADLVAGLDSAGRQIVKLAPSGTLSSAASDGGIMIYEYGPAAFAGFDPYLTTYSDLDVAPLAAGVQVVAGDASTKVVFTNTTANSFLGIRAYPGRTMVLGIGATPTVIVGDFLVPGAGTETGGYWLSTATAAGAWMVITSVDTSRAEVEARMLF
jgi:hypothetical protein